jgi:hypothetical protein
MCLTPVLSLQVVLDQAVYDGGFIQEFNEAEYKLKAVSSFCDPFILSLSSSCPSSSHQAPFSPTFSHFHPSPLPTLLA